MMMKGGNKILARSLMTQVNSTSLCHLCFPHSFVFGSFILRQKTMDSVPVIRSTEFLCIYVWGAEGLEVLRVSTAIPSPTLQSQTHSSVLVQGFCFKLLLKE